MADGKSIVFPHLFVTHSVIDPFWQVSKWFYATTCGAALWKSLYRDSPFPCPPTPLPAQSNTPLEQALVRSSQIAQSWETPSLRIVSYVQIPLDGKTPGLISGLDLIGSRWLIACRSSRQFVLYDTNAKVHTPQILWEQKRQITSWDKCSMVKEGCCIIYVSLVEEHSTHWYVTNCCNTLINVYQLP